MNASFLVDFRANPRDSIDRRAANVFGANEDVVTAGNQILAGSSADCRISHAGRDTPERADAASCVAKTAHIVSAGNRSRWRYYRRLRGSPVQVRYAPLAVLKLPVLPPLRQCAITHGGIVTSGVVPGHCIVRQMAMYFRCPVAEIRRPPSQLKPRSARRPIAVFSDRSTLARRASSTNGGVAARLSRFAFSAHEPTAVFSCPVVLRSSALLPFAVLFLPVVFASSAQKPVAVFAMSGQILAKRFRAHGSVRLARNRKTETSQPLPPLPLILGQCPSSKRGVLPAMHVRAQGAGNQMRCCPCHLTLFSSAPVPKQVFVISTCRLSYRHNHEACERQ